jgi:hypothetical protein
MNPLEAATASGDAVNGLASHFMLDMATYARGGELGFDGLDFYVAGRGGALGEVDAAVVTAAFVFWNPDHVAASWDRSASVLSRAEAARAFAAAAHAWADEHLPSDGDLDRVAELAGRIADAASVAAAPLFAGWRTLPEPTGSPAALALHRCNALRELRGALHGAAVVCQGIAPHDAVACRTPYMLGVFGWPEADGEATDDLQQAWDGAQAATERALAPAYAALDEAERTEFVDAINALQAAVTAG